MKRFVEGADRSQIVLFPESLDDYIDDDNPVRMIDVFVDDLIWQSWLRWHAAGGDRIKIKAPLGAFICVPAMRESQPEVLADAG